MAFVPLGFLRAGLKEWEKKGDIAKSLSRLGNVESVRPESSRFHSLPIPYRYIVMSPFPERERSYHGAVCNQVVAVRNSSDRVPGDNRAEHLSERKSKRDPCSWR
jgi:hypothetical protein